MFHHIWWSRLRNSVCKLMWVFFFLCIYFQDGETFVECRRGWRMADRESVSVSPRAQFWCQWNQRWGPASLGFQDSVRVGPGGLQRGLGQRVEVPVPLPPEWRRWWSVWRLSGDHGIMNMFCLAFIRKYANAWTQNGAASSGFTNTA